MFNGFSHFLFPVKLKTPLTTTLRRLLNKASAITTRQAFGQTHSDHKKKAAHCGDAQHGNPRIELAPR
jgi:hypothetical protein